MLTANEFERAWEMLLDKYGLENHPFLTQIYEVRHKWAKPYFRDIFCAKQTSTQKSETVERLLAKYVPPDRSMDLFVKQYEELHVNLNIIEVFQGKRTSIDEIVLRTNLPIEKHASEVYTRTMYEMFRKTLCESEFYEVEHSPAYKDRPVNCVCFN
ncbi:protein FAR1-RELATED SEQUENCE 5-like [Brachypodium distachyon]|uniref:protein FAR1-RELATED SEQUENCE 5-like n=1 Tax=Brachypodium distachyon TaxID=15368 RepID=UPI000D0D4B34|nr:protein FAR1-RELATED SEQUENCE 5-like [Brachypodium distachyon]|eukprot:XP_024317246.1 protein FAR1-RELATED SEQUENCE 5-like [Brachypodium distachyon]